MAKAKTAPAAQRAKRGRPAAPRKTSKTLGYRVTPAYLEWLERVAKINRGSISGLIDQAVANYAKVIGVTDPPPDRRA